MTPKQRIYAHIALLDWASWNLTHIDKSAIGFPCKTMECRMMRGEIGGQSPAHSISPDVMSGPRINWVNQVVSALPWPARAAVRWKYEEGGIPTEGERMREWSRQTGLRERGYYEALDDVYKFVST